MLITQLARPTDEANNRKATVYPHLAMLMTSQMYKIDNDIAISVEKHKKKIQ